MNILLTHGYFLEEDPKEQEIMRPYVPLGILYISAWLLKNGIDNEIFDSTFSSFDKLKEHLSARQPGVVGIYVNLMTRPNVLRIIRFIRTSGKMKNTKVILGGPEVTHHAEKFLEYGADVVVIGEGEETMLELTRHYSNNPNTPPLHIPGIVLQNQKGEIIRTAPRLQIKNMDDLPMPNREGVNLQLYLDTWKKRHNLNAISVNTMRGCPYTCKWCSRAVYGLSYRRRSPKLVADELEWLQQKFAFDTIWFTDDVFTISHRWLEEFAAVINQRKINIKYECITRADRMNESVIALLKQSGCFRVWIGAESGSQKVIDLMDRRVNVEQVKSMILLSKKYGLEAGTFIMLGYPGETESDILETLHYLKASAPDHFTITTAYPIKGTPMYEEVEHLFQNQTGWENETDRQIQFKRTYPQPYYRHAVQWIVNEMNVHRLKNQNGNFLKLAWMKTKALGARTLMHLSK